ncbi:protein of unknown function [Candidatus Methylocalor cossyra]|uniref:Uncharacterized protein n=1 Tax=Candidatus Methylocalor cossyra TaxID=3108543 RepID=A0ABM9NM97_9GAMM
MLSLAVKSGLYGASPIGPGSGAPARGSAPGFGNAPEPFPLAAEAGTEPRSTRPHTARGNL